MDTLVCKSFLPEILLSFFLLYTLVINVCLINAYSLNFPILIKENFIQIILILSVVLILLVNNKIEGYFFNFLFINDLSTKSVKILLILLLFFSLFSIYRGFISQNLNLFEYFIIFFISILSILLLINASDMLTVYLLIEMQTLSFYILACFKRNSSFSTEAGLKYFISGSFISGVFLLGCSLIFFICGTLNLNNLNLLLSFPLSNDYNLENICILIGVSLVVIVFLFKIVSVPFHFWSPDVYEGSPLSSTIIFSILPKLSILYIFIKWLIICNIFYEIKYILLISGLLSVFFGSFFAVAQKRLKRLILYSSIAQVGFVVVALSNLTVNSLVGSFFFIVIYLITSILIWTNFSLFLNFQTKINIFNSQSQVPLFLSTISNFFKVNKTWAFSNILIFFSLAGIPPLVGFFSKLLIISSVIDSKNLISSFLLLIFSILSVFYYLKMIKIIFFETEFSSSLDYSQVILKDFNFEYDCLVISFFLYLLIFIFSFPSYLQTICYIIVCDFYFF